MDRRRLGGHAEALARKFLLAHGVRLIQANFRCRSGEIDLVGIHNGVLIVVEVRMRSNDAFGNAADSVGRRKRSRIIRATQYMLMRHPDLNRYRVRFDVITVDGARPPDIPHVVWLRAAFDAPPWPASRWP